jgi:hypothetical protein
MEHTIKQLEAERNKLRGELIAGAKWIIDDMREVIERMERPEPGNVNSLGVLQNNGVQFDILCARYMQVKHHLEIIQAEMETAK